MTGSFVNETNIVNVKDIQSNIVKKTYSYKIIKKQHKFFSRYNKIIIKPFMSSEYLNSHKLENPHT